MQSQVWLHFSKLDGDDTLCNFVVHNAKHAKATPYWMARVKQKYQYEYEVLISFFAESYKL